MSFQDPSIFLRMIQIYSLWWSGTLLCTLTTFSLSHSSVDGCIGCFHNLAHKTCANKYKVDMHISLYCDIFDYLEKIPRKGIPGSNGISIYSFCGIFTLISIRRWMILETMILSKINQT